ncbi:MAG: Uma2 family endonuclease [Acidobacteriia bacterium]|nr:Uma2 family endonuclease [Terriglobia bacterium]
MATTTLLSAEEFWSLPEEPGKQELLDGELISVPPAKLIHLRIIKNLVALLETVLPKSRVWSEGGYQLGPRSWLQPDVSVTWPEQPVENDWLQGAPMVAVEVVSPANRPEHVDKKTAAYLEHGAAEVWVIYPATPSMAVFRKGSWERITMSYHSNLLGITIDLEGLLAPAE